MFITHSGFISLLILRSFKCNVFKSTFPSLISRNLIFNYEYTWNLSGQMEIGQNCSGFYSVGYFPKVTT